MKIIALIILVFCLTSKMTLSVNDSKPRLSAKKLKTLKKRQASIRKKAHGLRIEIPTSDNGWDIQEENPIQLFNKPDNLDWTVFKIIVATFIIGSGVEFYQKHFHASEKLNR